MVLSRQSDVFRLRERLTGAVWRGLLFRSFYSTYLSFAVASAASVADLVAL
ncbi:unnamed protein product [Chondrus crispus]|uniref:Uncharacterized protein n=1 Tax=Chondrus crispus TaxID=2769 RepID=R7QD52_CHOCR|nr:unnamed protein product [Chondrus crispus]CDF35974.1 unnamed protein product [Chondrus crispus]|eukprot:XP_005715793.1 unnamed protein product [Chondrus crispus]